MFDETKTAIVLWTIIFKVLLEDYVGFEFELAPCSENPADPATTLIEALGEIENLDLDKKSGLQKARLIYIGLYQFFLMVEKRNEGKQARIAGAWAKEVDSLIEAIDEVLLYKFV